MQNFGGGLEVGVQGDTFTVTLTFPGSAAAGNGAAPAARMEVFGTAETCGENDGGDTEHAAEPDALPCRPADVSDADTNKARGACATAPETPEPCGVSTGIPDTAPVPETPAGTSGAVKNAHASGRPNGTDGCSPYGEAAAFSDKAAAAAASPSETAAQAEPKEPAPAQSVPPSKTEENSGAPSSVSPAGRRNGRRKKH